MIAKDIMNEDVIFVYENDSIEKIAKIFLENRIGGLPVVDTNKKVVGIVSETDILKKENKNIDMPPFISILQGIIYLDSFKKYEEQIKKISSKLAKDIMSTNIIKSYEQDDLNDVIKLMIDNTINRLPVVDEQLKLKGIICRYDIIKALYK